jgi:hypothetical protein
MDTLKDDISWKKQMGTILEINSSHCIVAQSIACSEFSDPAVNDPYTTWRFKFIHGVADKKQ